MKTASLLTALSAVALFTVSPRAHAAAVDFSKLYGAYKSTYSLQTGGTAISGKVRTTVTPQGSKARMQIVGSGATPSSPGVVFALLGNLVFAPNHVVKADNALLAFYIQIPASAHFTSSSGRITFRLIGAGGFTSADITYKLRFSGRKLSIVGTGTISGSTPITITLRGTKVGS